MTIKDILSASLRGLVITAAFSASAMAELDVKITPELEYIDVQHNSKTVRIQREQNTENRLTNSFAKTSRTCPPFCVQPIRLLEDVTTVAEIEVIEFLDNQVKTGQGLLVDSRMPEWHEKGTIPGAVNIPFTILSQGLDSEHIVKIIQLLGAREQSGKWDFSRVRELMLFCNGPWCEQSTLAINNLAKIGYPQEKMFWYRGGMQAWQQVGLTVVEP